MSGVRASVVITTKDRREDLARCLDALRRQSTGVEFEIVVVDDGTEPPLTEQETSPARLVRGGSLGVGGGRNRGAAEARGELLVFTDDDTEPASTWVDAAVEHLTAHPDHAGAHGPVDSPPWDPLHGHSLRLQDPGSYYGVNVAFRADVFHALGGYAADLPGYQGEDLDLAFRALEHGPIGWAPGMRLTHYPRTLSFAQLARRGRHAANEVVVFRRHRSRFGRAAKLPAYLFPYANIVVVWGGELRAESPGILLRPVRLARLLAIAAGQALYATASLARLARQSIA